MRPKTAGVDARRSIANYHAHSFSRTCGVDICSCLYLFAFANICCRRRACEQELKQKTLSKLFGFGTNVAREKETKNTRKPTRMSPVFESFGTFPHRSGTATVVFVGTYRRNRRHPTSSTIASREHRSNSDVKHADDLSIAFARYCFPRSD